MGPLHQGKIQAPAPQELLQIVWQGSGHKKRTGAAQGRAGDTHTSTLEAVHKVQMGLERKGEQTGAMESTALGGVDSRDKVFLQLENSPFLLSHVGLEAI